MPGKRGKKGQKGIKGQPIMYDELKKVVAVSLTPTAVQRLDVLAESMDVTRSELIEQVARGTYPVFDNKQAERLGESSITPLSSSAINLAVESSTRNEKSKSSKLTSLLSY